jgi:hypothetical protein
VEVEHVRSSFLAQHYGRAVWEMSQSSTILFWDLEISLEPSAEIVRDRTTPECGNVMASVAIPTAESRDPKMLKRMLRIPPRVTLSEWPGTVVIEEYRLSGGLTNIDWSLRVVV